MNINVTTNISKDHGEDIEVIINTSKITKELEDLINLINETSKGEINTILGKDDNKISIIIMLAVIQNNHMVFNFKIAVIVFRLFPFI